MSEYELSYLSIETINLAYRAGEYWVAMTTALVVVVYLAARRISVGFLGLIITLYLASTLNSIWESLVYMEQVVDYVAQLENLRERSVEAPKLASEGTRNFAVATNLLIYAFGKAGATWYSITHWRTANSKSPGLTKNVPIAE